MLEGLPSELTPEQTMRRRTLGAALDILSPAQPPLAPETEALLEEASGWPDAPLFRLVHKARSGQVDAAAADLEEAMARLDLYPAPIQHVVLPYLLEVAVEAMDWRRARDVAAYFALHRSLRDGAAYRYLLGRAAELGDDPVVAFDNYAEASAARDLWGHRARLALIDLGLKSETLTPEDHERMLVVAAQLWSGDEAAIALRQRLAHVQVTRGNTAAALEALGRILARHPDSEQARLAQQQVRALLGAFYAEGAAGDLPLARFLEGHRRIANHFRFHKDFDRHAEAFADRFLTVGATEVAAREYATIFDYLSVARDLGLQEPSPLRLAELRLKRAGALMQGGQLAAAAPLLADLPEGAGRGLADRLNVLRAQLFDETGQSAAVLDTYVSAPSIEYLRIKATAHFMRADWAEAQEVYGRIWFREKDQMRFSDALNLLLSAYRTADKALVLELVEAFPKLTEVPQWSEIARGLLDETPALLPLRNAAAKESVTSAQRTLEALQAIDFAID